MNLRPNHKIDSRAKTVAEILGFVSRSAKDSIIADICNMIHKQMEKELDGYLLAIFRVTANDLAKECISEAYLKNNISIPQKYIDQFRLS